MNLARICFLSFIFICNASSAATNNLRILSFDPNGILTFQTLPAAASYQVEWTTNISASEWSSSAPGITNIPAEAAERQTITVAVNYSACCYRVLVSSSNEWLSVTGDHITGQHSNVVQLRGINIYFGSFRGEVEPDMINEDDPVQKNFLDGMLRNIVTEKDFADMRQMGMNMARLGLSTYKDFENDAVPFTYFEQNFESLDRLVEAASRQQIYLIFNMRQSPGGHNFSPHSGNEGKNELWENSEYQNRLVKLWETIANRYKDQPIIAGYDVINEPDAPNREALNEVYTKLIAGIRSNDSRHIIFLEGNTWATNLALINPPSDSNCALSVHFYKPAWYTHLIETGDYPNVEEGFTKEALHTAIVERVRNSLGLPVWVGEFGAKTYQPTYLTYSQDVKNVLDEIGLSWSYYSYKNTKGSLGSWAIYEMYQDNLFHQCVKNFDPDLMSFGDFLAQYSEEELTAILESLQTIHFYKKEELWEMLSK